jgi:hypothetical protein
MRADDWKSWIMVNGSNTSKKNIPVLMTRTLNNLPRSLRNVISPNPTVHMVETIQYNPDT